MPNDPLRVMCLHGLNRQEATEAQWRPRWEAAVREALGPDGPEVVFDFPRYDDLFADEEISVVDTWKALREMLGSGILHGLLGRGESRGSFDLPESLRWTAGMVVLWAQSDAVRRGTRKVLAGAIEAFRPDLLVAHSLGSLIAYDTLSTPAASGGASLGEGLLLTVGSQVGNPFVRNEFGGYLTMPTAARWVNVHNPRDPVFTTRIRLVAPGFTERVEAFGEGGDRHDAVGYLSTAAAAEEVFTPLAAATGKGAVPLAAATRSLARAAVPGPAATARAPDRRALLVGINEYPRPEDRLSGCVNDAFLVSSVLQESGFAAEHIRLLLDGRATADAIRERLDWLLDDPRPGDIRFFFYSGHGAQVPTYGPEEVVDRMDEVLVAHGFDWSAPAATGIVDDDLVRRYAQLPYDLHFVMMLDCCHAGGVGRAAGGRVRGVTPPDDIRHRALRWDPRRATWVSRDLPDLNPGATDRSKGNGRFFAAPAGSDGLGLRRLGRGTDLRRLSDAAYREVTADRGHRGPYLPMILEACSEGELSFEYEHGSHSYGAFSYTLARVLRQHRAAGTTPTFTSLVAEVAAELPRLGYAQTPALTGPTALKASPVPWPAAQAPRARARRRRRTR